jgi:hypothetical protein
VHLKKNPEFTTIPRAPRFAPFISVKQLQTITSLIQRRVLKDAQHNSTTIFSLTARNNVTQAQLFWFEDNAQEKTR